MQNIKKIGAIAILFIVFSIIVLSLLAIVRVNRLSQQANISEKIADFIFEGLFISQLEYFHKYGNFSPKFSSLTFPTSINNKLLALAPESKIDNNILLAIQNGESLNNFVYQLVLDVGGQSIFVFAIPVGDNKQYYKERYIRWLYINHSNEMAYVKVTYDLSEEEIKQIIADPHLLQNNNFKSTEDIIKMFPISNRSQL